jgi:hypothetical protein
MTSSPASTATMSAASAWLPRPDAWRVRRGLPDPRQLRRVCCRWNTCPAGRG